jgi:hypothetical protein
MNTTYSFERQVSVQHFIQRSLQMFCKFCQMNIKGTPCQTQSAANQCANNRGREPDYDDDDYRITQFVCHENSVSVELPTLLKDETSSEK